MKKVDCVFLVIWKQQEANALDVLPIKDQRLFITPIEETETDYLPIFDRQRDWPAFVLEPCLLTRRLLLPARLDVSG